MANTVRLPYSNTSGNVPSALGNGVLGINQASGSLYYRNSSGAVTQFSPAASLADGSVTTAKLADPLVYDCGAYAALVPAVPTGLTVTASTGQAALAWTAPTNTGGVSLTDYTIQYSSNAGSSYTTFSHSASTTTSATITGLSTGSYLFRVAAVNSVGAGSYVTSSSTSISASSSILTMARNNNGGVITTWSGTGTTASPFFRAAGIYLDDVDGLSRYSWTASASGTVTVSFTFNDDDDNGWRASVTKNGTAVNIGVGGSPATQFGGNPVFYNSGNTTGTLTVASGDVIRITSQSTTTQYFANVSVSAA
jgi:hypothetical protein